MDADEIYKVSLVKKKSFWFELIPGFKQKVKTCFFYKLAKKKKNHYKSEQKQAGELDFAYSIEPFGEIVKKWNLGFGDELGLRFSSCQKNVISLDFSVLN